MKRLAILGASGHGKVLADAAILSGWELVVFFDDAWPNLKTNAHWPVVGNTESLVEKISDFDGVIVAIGNNAIRLEKIKYLQRMQASIVSLIHPKAIISNFSSIGTGTFVAAGAVIQVDSDIGIGCIINTNAVIEHDCILGAGVHVSPAASLAGAVTVSDKSWIGLGASVKQRIYISSNVTVGAGCVVVKDIQENTTVIGNPARELIKK